LRRSPRDLACRFLEVAIPREVEMARTSLSLRIEVLVFQLTKGRRERN
jgi:hypothetical protein